MGRGHLSICVALFAGCGFTVSAGPIDAAGGEATDADLPPPDAGMCTAASQACANATTLRTCSGNGSPAVDTLCAWGCKPTGPAHCGQLVPSGGALQPADLSPNNLVDVALGAVIIDGDSGLVTGSQTGVFSYSLVGTIAVFRARSIRFNGTVTLAGTRSIVFAASDEIRVSALIDARGPCTLAEAGPGGGPGGAYTMDGTGPGGGRLAPASVGPGAGGGGYGAAGGRGGNGDGSGGLGGVVYGNAEITPLVGGSGGGGGGGGGGNATKAQGGGGGGALQLASNTGIRIDSTGAINAGGCGGKGSNNDGNDGAGGGGSGGAILLEAPTVDIQGQIAVNGGGGGAAKDNAGASGGITRAAALGGNNTNDGGPGGFSGGLGGGVGASDVNTGGGGGGGVGRIRVNTRTGAVTGTGSMSPGFDDLPTTATKAAANVQ